MTDDKPYIIEFSPNNPSSPNNDGKEWQEYRIVDKETGAKSTPIKRAGSKAEIELYVEEMMGNRALSLVITSSGGKNKRRWSGRGKGINI